MIIGNFQKISFNNQIFKIYDLIVIGAGPAGISSVIYASRAMLDILVFESEFIGGKINKTGLIENYPGFSSISGFDLSEIMKNQLMKYKFDLCKEHVIGIEKINNIFKICSSKNRLYFSKSVIVATGCKEKRLEVCGEKNFLNKGVSYYSICDGYLFRNKNVAIVGGGYSGCEASLRLNSIAKKVYLIHHGDNLKVDLELKKKIENNKKIEIFFNTEVEEILGFKSVEKLVLKKSELIDFLKIDIDGIFPCIGISPNSDMVKDFNFFNKSNKFINVNENFMTEISGLFSAGDVLNKLNRQIITAASDGANAAQSAIYYIQKEFF